MLRSFRLSAVVLLLALAGCASSEAPSERAAPHSSFTIDQRIGELESAAQQLRNQHAVMGETIARLESRIATLKQTGLPVAAPKPAEPPPAPAAPAPAAEPEKPAAEAAPATEPEQQKEEQVAALTEEDMVQEAPKPVDAAAVPDSGYLLHIASYLQEEQVKPGWAQLSAQYAKPLEGTKGYTTSFKDDRGRTWQRLSAGVFVREDDAKDRCSQLKAAGGWCEVISAQRKDTRAVE